MLSDKPSQACEVVNIRQHRGKCFRIDRTGPLGNDYTHLPLHLTNARYKVKTRSEAIERGLEALHNKLINNDTAVVEYLAEIIVAYLSGEDVILGCWCKPRDCHGDQLLAGIMNDEFLSIDHVDKAVERLLRKRNEHENHAQ